LVGVGARSWVTPVNVGKCEKLKSVECVEWSVESVNGVRVDDIEMR
jgi:hypothetical protein